MPFERFRSARPPVGAKGLTGLVGLAAVVAAGSWGASCARAAAPPTESEANHASESVSGSASEAPLACSLEPLDFLEREKVGRALVESIVGKALRVEGGYRLALPADRALDALRLLLLERDCCVGVHGEVRVRADDPAVEVTVQGPTGFAAVLGRILEAAGKL